MSTARSWLGCHTYPNDRLLQQAQTNVSIARSFVVIPTQTIGFYNKRFLVGAGAEEVVIPTQTIGFYNTLRSCRLS